MESTSDAHESEEKKQSKADKIGDRMKSYESKYTSTKLDPTLPFIIRLDGHKFSSYTRPFKKPFDERISNVMVATTMDLLNVFNPTTAFTCSDEITLLFPAMSAIQEETEDNEDQEESTEEPKKEEKKKKKEKEEPTIMFSGKVSKLSSLTAGYASARFNLHMSKQVFDPATEKKLIEHLERTTPYFDSRVFHVPGNEELLNNVIWRCHFDYRRNSISGLARCYFSTKQMHKLNSTQLLEMLVQKGVSWDSMPDAYKYGTFVKKEKYEIEGTNPKGEAVKAQRSRVVAKSIDIGQFNEENLKFMVSKYINE